MSEQKKKGPQVECPNCENKFYYYESKFRPFCSEKCRMIDLGLWLNEGYAIPSQRPLDEEDIDHVEREWSKKEDGSY